MNNLVYDTELTNINYLGKVPYLEAKLKFDPVTYKHSINVARLCLQLLKFSDYSVDEDLIYYVGLFHDIGKTKITTHILQKNCKLTSFEFNQMMEHTTLGYNILLKHNFPTEVLLAAQLHHEKYDGTGYPLGLIANETPIVARIVSICDVFDALTSDRPYRKAYSMGEALQIMSNSTGQFDPELFSIFISKISRIVYSSELLKRNGDVIV